MTSHLKLFTVAASSVLLFSCVGRKKYDAIEAEYTTLRKGYNDLQTKCADDLKALENARNGLNADKTALQAENGNLKNQVTNLNDQIDYLKKNNNQVLGNLKDLSVLSDKQAESVKKSLDKLSERDIYIKDLQTAMQRKDSLNMALIMNLKGALADVQDDDIEVKVEKGVVFISISDKLLFNSGSYVITPKAKTVLGKVATVLNNQPNIEFLVEGHTDNQPIKSTVIKDNWDLSVLRATAVTRVLQNDYKIDPKRMTAGGRSYYVPVADNTSAQGRSLNRRTRIVVLPQLDQFFQLLTPDSKATQPGQG